MRAPAALKQVVTLGEGFSFDWSAAEFTKSCLLASESVWWVAGPETPEYYGVPLAHDDATPGRAFSPQRKDLLPSLKDLRALPLADVIVFAKRDAFAGSAEAWIVHERNYQRTGEVRGFQFFTHPLESKNRNSAKIAGSEASRKRVCGPALWNLLALQFEASSNTDRAAYTGARSRIRHEWHGDHGNPDAFLLKTSPTPLT